MNIHIFNPEHEMALAANVKRFTAPHAGRELRHDLGYLPMVWADEGDYILVDDPEACMESMRHLRVPLHGRLMNYNDFHAMCVIYLPRHLYISTRGVGIFRCASGLGGMESIPAGFPLMRNCAFGV